MTKAEIEEQCLSAYVVMPAVLEVAFKEWWQALKSSDVITIRYPHACHGNARRKSNSMQKQVEAIFRDKTQSSQSDVQVLVIATFLFCNKYWLSAHCRTHLFLVTSIFM